MVAAMMYGGGTTTTINCNYVTTTSSSSPFQELMSTTWDQTTSISYDQPYSVRLINDASISNITRLEWRVLVDGTLTVTQQTYGGGVEWSMESKPLLSPQEKLRQILQKRMSPYVVSSRKSLKHSKDVREERARETLQRVIGKDQFRNFVKNGFVTAKAKSGKIYQIFPGYDMTKVYDKGQLVEKLCVVLQGNFPPTDSVIMRYLMILNNEDKFRGKAVKWGANPVRRSKLVTEERSLTEIYAGLKAG